MLWASPRSRNTYLLLPSVSYSARFSRGISRRSYSRIFSGSLYNAGCTPHNEHPLPSYLVYHNLHIFPRPSSCRTRCRAYAYCLPSPFPKGGHRQRENSLHPPRVVSIGEPAHANGASRRMGIFPETVIGRVTILWTQCSSRVAYTPRYCSIPSG